VPFYIPALTLSLCKCPLETLWQGKAGAKFPALAFLGNSVE
jgi:hypothetical protein